MFYLWCYWTERSNVWQSAENSLNFKANDENLEFNNRNLNANDNYSGGLLVLGSLSIF